MSAQLSPPVTVTIITLNEEESLPRAIVSAQWADEVIVVDSGSTDRTVELAREMGARVLYNPWSGYGQQKNFAQKHSKNDWILNIDADEEIPEELRDEINKRLASNPPDGFFIPRKTFYMGKWIKHGGWYPNYLIRLANRKHAQWSEPNVHESWNVTGTVEKLANPLHHFTFSSIEDQILTNLRYSRQGFRDLWQKGQRASFFKLMFKPIGKFLETYFIKMGILDGLPGLIISINAAHSMFLKYAYLFETGWKSED